MDWGGLPIVTTFHHLDPATNLTLYHQSDVVMTVSSQWHQHLTQLGIPENHQALVPFGVGYEYIPSTPRRKLAEDP